MDTLVSLPKHKNYIIFLNISFLFVSCAFLIVHFYSPDIFLVLSTSQNSIDSNSSEHRCNILQSLDDYKAKCFYLKSGNPCVSQGYINYLYLFYCNFGKFPLLGHFLLFLWLLVLFYILGNTASEYFCPSLESLSRLWKLPPAIAGVTLLSLGNGAPDVFASLVSFMDGGTGEIGLNTVLGGASFVSCVVVGIISISMRRRCIRVNKSDFIRDVCFFLLVIVWLIVIVIRDEIDVWVAVAFLAMYIVYVILVYISHIRRKNIGGEETEGGTNFGQRSDLSIPILQSMENGKLNESEIRAVEEGSEVEVNKSCFCLGASSTCSVLLCILEMPLSFPRRLTIPVVSEEKWSKQYAVASVTLAPILLSALWNHQVENGSFKINSVVYGVGLGLGLAFGALAFMTTEKSSPPKKCLYPWLISGFLMSITWSYIIAQELVGLLNSFGYILGVNPSLIGLTVLAWGNSLGDLMTNLTLALKGGQEGAQVAFSGCYAGPIFNILFGLGLSLIGYAWSMYPSPIVIPRDPYLMQTLAFLGGGLLWALLVLPKRDMKLDGVLGGGLIVIYIISLCLRLFQALGSV